MILKEAFNATRKTFADNAIEDPDIEARLLLRHVLQFNPVQYYLSMEHELDEHEITTLDLLTKRRVKKEPLAYILGHREFYGLDFLVNNSVLIPRPESELLVDEILKRTDKKQPYTVADIGTGCGAIAIAIAKNLPGSKIYATDISSQALEIASINIHQHSVTDKVYLLQGNILEPLPTSVDFIVANLPYVKDSDWTALASEIKLYEPASSLIGGIDGLDKIREILRVADTKLKPHGVILLEIGCDQGSAVCHIAEGYLPDAAVTVIHDLSGLDRVVCIELSESHVSAYSS